MELQHKIGIDVRSLAAVGGGHFLAPSLQPPSILVANCSNNQLLYWIKLPLNNHNSPEMHSLR